jgi:tetrahydromethanopterin S-methyltransferase subunit G
MGTPTRDMLKDVPPLRPSSRSPHKALLGENTPPSATMMALQNMTIPQDMLDPLPVPQSEPTNSPAKMSTPVSNSSDAIANQLNSITAIVSSLQKDMSQLSRRSKDNATDLHGLKEATNQRDEDIRKSLKDLVSSMAQNHQAASTPVDFARSGSLDPFMTPTKPFAMPQRTGSPGWLDERIGSPNPYSVEGAASVAMLEKIIREMVTKDGQDRLVNALEKIVDRASGETAKKVAEMVEFVKQSSTNNPMHPAGSSEPSLGSGQGTQRSHEALLNKIFDSGKPYASPKAADFVSDEMLKFLRKIKDSVAESGGVLMSNKTLIQDLRGEVLGMGRELARKIEEAVNDRPDQHAIEPSQQDEEIGHIVQSGLADLKEHMDNVMRDRRRQSVSSVATRNTVDSNEVYDVVKNVFAERGLDNPSSQIASFDKEAIVSAVREAYEEYQPDNRIQTIGLQREEVLECLREGLQDLPSSTGVSREEIEHIIRESLQQIQLPPPINEAHEIRDEVLFAVRECLEELKPALAPQQLPSGEMSREIILEAMREALSEYEPPASEMEIPHDSLSEAVRAGLESSRALTLTNEDPTIHQLQSLVEEMHSQFKVSSTTGNDTEQVLDALHHVLDQVRTQIESYVEKAQDVTHKDEIVDSIRAELEQLRTDVQGYVAEGSRGDQADGQEVLVSFMKSEFERLLEEMAKQHSPAGQDKEEIIQVLHAGFQGINSQVESMNSQVVATRGLELEPNENVNVTMKEEFDQLKDVLLSDTASHKGDLMEKLQTGFDGMHVLLDEHASAGTNDNVIAALKEEFEHLRETLAGALVRSGGAADKDDIIDAVRELVDGLHSAQANAAKDNMVAFQQDLDSLKESIGNTLVRTEDPSEKIEILEALNAGLAEIKANSALINPDLLEAFRGEFRISTAQVQQRTHDESVEIMDAVRLNVDDLRSHLEKKLDNPDRQMSATNEILDALNDGLEGLRSDVEKAVNKPVEPVDMTLSYEILDTLKAGLAELRGDIEKLKNSDMVDDTVEVQVTTGNEVVLAEDPELAHADVATRDFNGEADIVSETLVGESLRRDDLEKMEVMLSQLQMKVEAMDINMQNSNMHSSAPSEPMVHPDTAMKEDLVGIDAILRDGTVMKDGLVAIEELLKDVQAAVIVLQDREQQPTAELTAEPKAAPTAGFASKDDTDAIETLLVNVKAKIDELPLPDPATTVTKEHLEEVELVVQSTSDALETLSKKIEEEGASKGDVTVIQVIVDDIKIALDEMIKADEEADTKATKADMDALSLLVDDMRLKMDELRIPDPDQLPSKTEIEELTGLVHDFKERYEDDIEVTSKSFDHRKKEAEGLSGDLVEVKTALTEMKEQIKESLAEGGPIDGLKESFKSLEVSIGTDFNVTADVKELMETVAREFERAHGSIADLEVNHAATTAETKEAIITGFGEKIDLRFDTLMAKYDDAQLLADEHAKVMKDKTEEQDKILEETKTMADELRLTIDTLGTSITSMNDRFDEATQKYSTESSTVFGKLDDAMAKLDDQKLQDQSEHSHTRDEIKNIENIFVGFQDNVTEYHPQFMIALREIEALVKAHYQHAQTAKEEAEEHARVVNEEAKLRAEEVQKYFSSLPALLPAPPPAIEMPEKYDDAQVHDKLDKLLVHVDKAEKTATQLERLDEIHAQVKATAAEVSDFVANPPAIEMPEKYDDAQVHDKLDQLLVHVDEAGKAANQLERLDEIHAQVKVTAAEVSDFVAKQTQLITDGTEAKEREAEELALLIERRSTQKEQLEADVNGLKAEKERMMQELREEKDRAMAEMRAEKDRNVQELKEEKDSLLAIVATLQAERENLADQRIRLTGQVSSLKTALHIRSEELHEMDAKADAIERRIINGIMDHSRAAMIAKGGRKSPTKSKKRSGTDAAAEASKLMPPPSTTAKGVAIALKPRPAIRNNGVPPNPGGRRIHSLSQISGNTPTGVQAYHPVTSIGVPNTGLKRSQSVRTANLRKGSWGGRSSASVANKENEVLGEEDETAAEQGNLGDSAPIIEEDLDDMESETGTERRHSIGTESYAASYTDGGTPGADGRSEYGDSMYSGSSYFTNSEADRRTSYGSSRRSTAYAENIDEHDEDDRSISDHSDLEDDDPTATALSLTTRAPSAIEGSEVSTATTSDILPDHTESEINRAVEEVVAEEMEKARFAAPSDSGVGTDLPTAAFGNESAMDADYFRRAAEEEGSTVG